MASESADLQNTVCEDIQICKAFIIPAIGRWIFSASAFFQIF